MSISETERDRFEYMMQSKCGHNFNEADHLCECGDIFTIWCLVTRRSQRLVDSGQRAELLRACRYSEV